MPDNEESTKESTKTQPKMVPESDLIAIKKKIEKLQGELTESKGRIAELQGELEVAYSDVQDDEEIKGLKAKYIDKEKELAKKEAELNQGLASLQEREKESRVQSLASQYGLEVDAIKDAEDPEKVALQLYAERLSKEKEELEKKAPESVFETESVGVVKKSIADMKPEEFEQHWEAQKKEAYAKQK